MYVPQNFILLPFHLPVSPSCSLYKCTDNVCNEAYTTVIVVILWWWDLELFLHLPCVILELFEFYVTNSCFNKNNSFIYKKKTLQKIPSRYIPEALQDCDHIFKESIKRCDIVFLQHESHFLRFSENQNVSATKNNHLF